ncbi:hypothetical protein INT43_005356 [Umbelopsis isabellina]|uniref:Uncharacterized protein n=1 Tax=Mortierella isabellina TaxID=91625 RepID=A0A8H7UDP6_MORIS|nr:hypothetical protein INT43_005356 [Umbelopsis isabellina]
MSSYLTAAPNRIYYNYWESLSIHDLFSILILNSQSFTHNIWTNHLSFLSNSLYSKGRVLGYERAKRNQNENTSLIQIEGVQTPSDAQFYLGKRIAFVYRAKREVNGSKIRVIWGRVTRAHGGNGVVKAKFRNNLPPKTFGASVRVMLYPSNI